MTKKTKLKFFGDIAFCMFVLLKDASRLKKSWRVWKILSIFTWNAVSLDSKL